MKGIRIYTNLEFVKTDGGRENSHFDQIFRPAYDLLGESYFKPTKTHIYTSSSKIDKQYESLVGVHSIHLIKKYGPYLDDDWNELLVLTNLEKPECVTTFRQVIKGYSAQKEYLRELLKQRKAHYFQSWDGAYWQCFSYKKELYDRLISAHKNQANIFMYWVDFELEYPDPSNTKLEAI